MAVLAKVRDRLRREIGRRRLANPDFAFLFQPPPPNEAVALDLEATGLDTRHAEIVAIGAVRILAGRVSEADVLHLLVRPRGGMSAGAKATHGMDEATVAQGMRARPALERLLRFLGPRPIVGYHLAFDLAMLNRYVRPWLGTPLPNPAIDVADLYYKRKTWALGGDLYMGDVDLRLQAILADLGQDDLPPHDALNDAVMAARAYAALNAPDVERRLRPRL